MATSSMRHSKELVNRLWNEETSILEGEQIGYRQFCNFITQYAEDETKSEQCQNIAKELHDTAKMALAFEPIGKFSDLFKRYRKEYGDDVPLEDDGQDHPEQLQMGLLITYRKCIGTVAEYIAVGMEKDTTHMIRETIKFLVQAKGKEDNNATVQD